MDMLMREQMELVARRALIHLKNDMIWAWRKDHATKRNERVSIEDFIDREQFLLLFSIASGAKLDAEDFAGWYETFEERVAEEARGKLVNTAD